MPKLQLFLCLYDNSQLGSSNMTEMFVQIEKNCEDEAEVSSYTQEMLHKPQTLQLLLYKATGF